MSFVQVQMKLARDFARPLTLSWAIAAARFSEPTRRHTMTGVYAWKAEAPAKCDAGMILKTETASGGFLINNI